MMRSNALRYSRYGKAPKKRGNGDLGHLAKRELTISGSIVLNSLARGFCFSLIAGLVVGFLGPFGTFEKLPILWRLAFWVSAIVGGYLFHLPLYWLGRFIVESNGWSIWIGIIGSAFVAALPTTVLVNGIAVSLLNTATTDSIGTLYPMVAAISLPLQFIGHLTAFKRPVELAKPDNEDLQAPSQISTTIQSVVQPLKPPIEPATILPVPPFFARVPGRLGKDLLCLQMEDHYVRAFTAVGSEMILMRMVDASRELEGYDGLLVHRSFWVARSAVAGWMRDGKNLTLRLSNNKKIPVARDRQAGVKAAGWLVGAGD
jgi:LytTr DNA-binding domain